MPQRVEAMGFGFRSVEVEGMGSESESELEAFGSSLVLQMNTAPSLLTVYIYVICIRGWMGIGNSWV